jgi:hypothetical protein
MVVSSAAGDDVIVGNDTAADSITYTTTGQQIGAVVDVEAHYINTTTVRWLMTTPQTPFGTGLTGGFAYAIATA